MCALPCAAGMDMGALAGMMGGMGGQCAVLLLPLLPLLPLSPACMAPPHCCRRQPLDTRMCGCMPGLA